MSFIEKILGSSEPVKEKKRIIGKIVKLHANGWGFIISKEYEFTRIFFHWTALNQDTLHFKELEKGMEVEFEVLEIEGRGLRAIRIDVLEDGEEDESNKE